MKETRSHRKIAVATATVLGLALLPTQAMATLPSPVPALDSPVAMLAAVGAFIVVAFRMLRKQ